jgi:cell division protease FtsH
MRWWRLTLPGTDPVHKISIIPRGIGALGYTLQRPTEDRYLATRSELSTRWRCCWAGGRPSALVVRRAILDRRGRRPGSDATDIARDMVTRYGMAEALGQVVR